MEFREVVRRRRMVRAYDADRSLDRAQIDRLLNLALKAPSAGFAQGWHFLVLDEDGAREGFWSVTTDDRRAPDGWLRGMRTAPVLILVFSERAAYERRYAGAAKRGASHAPSDLDERWTVPYWHLDAAMAAMLALLAAVDEGLGAAWFGVPPAAVPALRAEFSVPPTLWPVGVLAVGYPASGGVRPTSVDARRPRAEVVSYGRYGSSAPPDPS